MSDAGDDRLVDLYQRSRQEQPSARADRQIRRAARQSLSRRRSRWILPLSAAAVLVLSFNVVIDLYFDQQSWEEMVEHDDASVSASRERLGEETAAGSVRQSSRQRAAPAAARVLNLPPFSAGPDIESESVADSLSLGKENRGVNRLNMQAPSSPALIKPGIDLPARIPALPTTLAELLALDEGLDGRQTTAGSISIDKDNKTILMLKPEGDHFRFRAWEGAGALGIKVDWLLQPQRLTACRQEAVYLACALVDGVTGYFEGDRLDYIDWMQGNE